MHQVNIVHCFISKNLSINGIDFGPIFFSEKPNWVGDFQYIPRLDFGEVSGYDHIVPGTEEAQDMLGRLFKFKTLGGNYGVWVGMVIINGENFGEFKIYKQCTERGTT
jgi:hypothetical protein